MTQRKSSRKHHRERETLRADFSSGLKPRPTNILYWPVRSSEACVDAMEVEGEEKGSRYFFTAILTGLRRRRERKALSARCLSQLKLARGTPMKKNAVFFCCRRQSCGDGECAVDRAHEERDSSTRCAILIGSFYCDPSRIAQFPLFGMTTQNKRWRAEARRYETSTCAAIKQAGGFSDFRRPSTYPKLFS